LVLKDMQDTPSSRHATLAVDPITLEVIRHAMVSITNQIDANIKRTAFSAYIYEYNDFAVGLTDADGMLVAQCTGGMLPFVADSVGMAVRDGLQIYGKERLHHGDVVLCNHAAVQGQHLNNTVMYTPIYAGPGRATLIGFFAINVHWIDIGGCVPHSTDIFMEGLQLPLDQDSVKGRADRGGLSDHREQHAPAGGTDG
jgi:N-methylhydantoinase B